MKNALRQHPLFCAALAICAVLILAGLLMGLNAGKEVARSRLSVNRAASDLLAFKRAEPAPTEANLEAARTNRQHLEAAYANITAALAPKGAADPEVALPYSGAQDLYLEIAEFVEERRRTAAAANVALADDLRFGFARLLRARQIALSSGPAQSQDEMRLIARQKEVIEQLSNWIFAAAPDKLESIARSPVLATGEDLAQQIRKRPVEELFVIEPAMSAAVPGSIKATAYRLVFVGTTATLRSFLTTLAANPGNLVVRGIEVAAIRPAAQPAAKRPAAPAAPIPDSPFAFFGQPRPGTAEATTPEDTAAEIVPIVQANQSRFTVILEELSVIPQPPADAFAATGGDDLDPFSEEVPAP